MKQLSLTCRTELLKKKQLFQKIFGSISIVFLLTLGLANNVAATPMLDPCNIGVGCTVLGPFTGNDSEGTISSIVEMSVIEIFKSDPPGVDGNGVTVTVDGDMFSGTWSSDIAIDFVVAKAGNTFLLQDYLNVGGSATRGLWSTFGLAGNNGNQFTISHLTFYATQAFGPEPSGSIPNPEPSTILLLGTGIAGLIGYRIRKKMKSA